MSTVQEINEIIRAQRINPGTEIKKNKNKTFAGCPRPARAGRASTQPKKPRKPDTRAHRRSRCTAVTRPKKRGSGIPPRSGRLSGPGPSAEGNSSCLLRAGSVRPEAANSRHSLPASSANFPADRSDTPASSKIGRAIEDRKSVV